MSNFADVLGKLEDGIAFEEMNSALQELVQAVMMHRKAGEITLKLAVAPNGETAVSVKAKITAKVPEGARGVTVFFASPSGQLLRKNPNQPELPLRDAMEPRQPLRTA